MASFVEIEQRIKSYAAVENIVNAMKAYAGLTVRKTEALVKNIREYENVLLQELSDISDHHEGLMPENAEWEKRILIAFGSSQGLCSPYNESVAEGLSEASEAGDHTFVVGKRLKVIVDAMGLQYHSYMDSVASVSGVREALAGIISEVSTLYSASGVLNITILYSEVLQKRPLVRVERILPPDPAMISSITPSSMPPEIHLAPYVLFGDILEEFMYISIYRAFVESIRSENWYRLRRLEGASEAIERKTGELRMQQNYARQEEVTEEMRDYSVED